MLTKQLLSNKSGRVVVNDVKKESDGDVCMVSESRAKLKEQSRRQADRKILAEKMRDTLMRKSSLLATVKLKYQQVCCWH